MNSVELFYEIVAELREKEDMAIILISHDLNMVARHADQVVLMDKGVVACGTPEEVFCDSRTQRIFGMLAGQNLVELHAVQASSPEEAGRPRREAQD